MPSSLGFYSDFLFNTLQVLVDLAFLALARRAIGKPEGAKLVALWALFAGPASAMAALVVAYAGSLGIFGAQRFAGYAIFFHAPAVLLALAAICRRSRAAAASFSVIAASLISLYLYAFRIEPYWLEVSRHDYTHPLLKGLARPVTIAQVADIQTDHVGSFETRVFRTLAEIKPDIVVYCGDYIQSEDKAGYAAQLGKLRAAIVASGLAPPLGSYAVIGDTDYRDRWRDLFEGLDAKCLDNERVSLPLPGCEAELVGLRLETSRTLVSPEMKELLAGSRKDRLNIYVGHAPDFARALARTREPFLALAGHTHGGQVQLPFVGPLMTQTSVPRKYADDFLPFESGTLSVSRGIGMERRAAPRVRFLCRPEIRLITLRPSE